MSMKHSPEATSATNSYDILIETISRLKPEVVPSASECQKTAAFVKEFRRPEIEQQVRQALLDLFNDRPFVVFPSGLNPTLSKSAATIHIGNTDHIDILGKLHTLYNEVFNQVQRSGPNSPAEWAAVAETVCQLTASTIQACEKETAIVHLRMSTRSDLRWHQDGSFFFSRPQTERQYKLAFCVQGTSTFFCEPDLATRLRYEEIWRDSSQNKVNQIFNEQKVVMAKSGEEAALFRVGGNNAAFHSEPLTTSPRYFIGIIPCTFDELAEQKAFQQITQEIRS